MPYVFVLLTVLLTVYGQLVLKWQVDLLGPMDPTHAPLAFYARLLLNPWVLSALASAFGASLAWMAALSKLPLSHAYPITALSFFLVVVAGALLFGEPITKQQVAGVTLIVVGIAIGVRS